MRIFNLLFLLLFLLAANIQAQQVKISYVYDGDTFKTETGIRVRLYNINAPEKGQPNSYQATQLLKSLRNKTVYLKLKSFDKYGRQVCAVYYNGKDISLLLVEKGYAFIYWKYFDGNESFLAAQNKAKQLNLGIWKKYIHVQNAVYIKKK